MAKPIKALKIMLVGADGVGKTLVFNQFLSEGRDNTLGALINSTRNLVVDNEEYMLELMECEEFGFGNKVLTQDLKQADGFLFVFHTSSKASIEYLKQCKGSIAKERTKPLSCILVGTVYPDEQSATPAPVTTNATKDPKKNNSLRGRQTTVVPPPVRSLSTNGTSSPPPSPTITPDTAHNQDKTNDTTARDAQDLASLYETSLVRVVFRNRQADGTTIKDLFVQLVREITAAGNSRKKPKFRYSRCDSEDLQFVTDTYAREADSDTAPPSIKAASFPRLVERATYEKHPNPELVDDLLITYRAFSTASVFLDLLMGRYNLPKPNGVDKNLWSDHLQKAIRLRVISLLKAWVEGYPDDFNDTTFSQKLLNFVTNTIQKDHKTFADKLESAIRSRNGKAQASKLILSRFPPSRIKKKNPEHMLELSAMECARQLALIDHSMYKEILPLHCLHGTWSKDDPTNAVAAVIMRFNLVSAFLVSRILAEAKPKQRAKVIEKIISIADKCRMLNNFNALIMVMSSLENTAIYRLKDTWKLISNKRKDQFLALRSITGAKGNYAAIRKAVARASQPLVPYLGVYLSMLLFIEDGNKDTSEEGLINWEKFKMEAQVIKDIRQYQQSQYMFEVVPAIKVFFSPSKDKILDEEAAYTRSYTLEPGRVALSVRLAQTTNLGASSDSLIPPSSSPSSSPSPNNSLRWEKGKVSRIMQAAEAEDNSLITSNGGEEASRSIAQLYASQSNEFVALLNEWVLKMRHVSTVIQETTKVINDTTKAVLATQPILGSNPSLDKGDGSGSEETMKAIDYVATLTKSKVVEGIVEKFLTGATSTIPLTLYEWFGYTLIATPQFVKILVTSLHTIAKLKPLPELVVAISEMVGRLKAPPLDAKELWRRRKMALRGSEVVSNLHSNFAPSIPSPVQINTLRMDCSRQVVKILELIIRSAAETPTRTVDTDFSFLHDMVNKLRGKEFPKRTETLQAIAILLLAITQEYPSSTSSTSPPPPASPLSSSAPPAPFSSAPTPTTPVIGSSHSAPATLSAATAPILAPIPSRPGIPSALLGGPRTGSPNPAYTSSPNLRASASAILVTPTSTRPSSPSSSPSSSSSPSPSPVPSPLPEVRPRTNNRATPPRTSSPSFSLPTPALQRTMTASQPGSPRNRSTVNLTIPTSTPPDIVRSTSMNSLPIPISPAPALTLAHAPPLREPTTLDVAILPSPQAPSQAPRHTATKASPSKPQPSLSPTTLATPPPPSFSHNHVKPPALTLTPTPTSVVPHSTPTIPSPMPTRPLSGSYPCGLLGDWDSNVEALFKSYLSITYQYCASTRDQLIVYRKRLQKLHEVRNSQAIGTQFGVSEDALGEQLTENAQQARYIMDLVDTHEAESNQFVDWILDHAALSAQAFSRVDLALVRRIFATFHELRNIQEEIEQIHH